MLRNPDLAIPLCLLCCLHVTATSNAAEANVSFTVSEGTGFSASLSPDGRSIAIDLQGRLWVLPAGGGEARAITDPIDEARYPVWSPDSKQIAFQAYTDDNFHIWSIAPDGSDLRQLTFGPYDDREPHWSPDGHRIAFASDRNGNFDVYVVDLASGESTQFTEDPAEEYFPAWSPDGARIAYISGGERGATLNVISADERNPEKVSESENPMLLPAWHPDGSRLTYFTNSRHNFYGGATALYQIDISSGATELLTREGEDIFPGRVTWPSGRSFLYSADGGIRIGSFQNAEPTAVEFSVEFTVAEPPQYPRKDHRFDSVESRKVLGILRPVVSPDGKQIAFTALGDLWLLDIDASSKPKQLTDDPYLDVDPAFSRDGELLAYLSDRRGTGTMDLYIRDLSTGADRRVTETEEDLRMPAWSPDGRTIAVLMRDSRDWHATYVFSIDVASGAVERIHDGEFLPSQPSWSADGSHVVMAALAESSQRFRKGENRFFVINVDTGEDKIVRPAPGHAVTTRAKHGPVWSPDGSKMAYVFDGVLWIVPVDRTGSPIGPPRRLTSEPGDYPSWTGDSNSIVYLALDELKQVDLRDGRVSTIPLELDYERAIPSGRTVVHAGRLFDGISPEYLENVDIVIDGNRITTIVPHRKRWRNATLVDASNKTVLPGLFQMHIHHFVSDGEGDGRNWLAYGITSIREPGADPYESLERRESWDSGRRAGPRGFYAGILEGNRLYYWMNSAIASPAQIESELERMLRLDYDFIKTYERMTHRVQKRVTQFAHDHGLTVASHEIYPGAMFGVDVVEHMGTADKMGHSDRISYGRNVYDDVIQIMAKSGMAIVPTAAGRAPSSGYLYQMNRVPGIFNLPQFQAMPPRYQQSAKGLLEWLGGYLKETLQYVPNEQESILKMSEAGVGISTGTDGGTDSHGYSLILEIEHLADSGMGNFKALQAATIHAAAATGVGDDLGSIEQGKLADLVIIDGDPLSDISDLYKVNSVFRDGNRFDLQDLLQNPYAGAGVSE